MSPALQFTAHNILLPDGSYTRSGDEGLLADDPMCRSAVRLLQTHFSEPSRTTVADLGCLEGGYALEFARKGFRTTGVEVRKASFENCLRVQEQTGLANLQFVHDDVRNLAKLGRFDAIFCCGLLYHLDRPAEYLDLLAKQTNKLLLLQTHYARSSDPLYDFQPVQLAARGLAKTSWRAKRTNYRLSRLTMHEGLRGRWFNEFSAGTTTAKQEELRWASWQNPRSFWIVKEDLIQRMMEAGFTHVFEAYDHLGDARRNDYISRYDRSLFVGLKA